MIDQKFELYTQAVSWKRSIFHDDWTFSNIVSKNSKECCLFLISVEFDAKILKICKIHRKSRIKQMSVLFCKYLCKKSLDLYEI